MIRWKAGEIIRHKDSGHPFLVLTVQRGVCTFLTDAEDPYPTPIVILEHQYHNYVTDKEMREEVKKNDLGYTITWSYTPVTL